MQKFMIIYNTQHGTVFGWEGAAQTNNELKFMDKNWELSVRHVRHSGHCMNAIKL